MRPNARFRRRIIARPHNQLRHNTAILEHAKMNKRTQFPVTLYRLYLSNEFLHFSARSLLVLREVSRAFEKNMIIHVTAKNPLPAGKMTKRTQFAVTPCGPCLSNEFSSGGRDLRSRSRKAGQTSLAPGAQGSRATKSLSPLSLWERGPGVRAFLVERGHLRGALRRGRELGATGTGIGGREIYGRR